jgi:prevent-host-death family protein
MSETLALADVKAHLSQLVSRVNAQHDRVTVTVHGRPSAVLLSVDDLEALDETIAILSDSDALKQLAASDAELARGEGETEQDLADAPAGDRLVGARLHQAAFFPAAGANVFAPRILRSAEKVPVRPSS